MCDQALITMVPAIVSLPIRLPEPFYEQLRNSWCHSSCFATRSIPRPDWKACGTRPPVRFVSHNGSYTHGVFILIFIDEYKCSVGLWTHQGKQNAAGSPCCNGQHFHPFCLFFSHYFWIRCHENMSDCFCFWFRSPLTVLCLRFVVQMFITFVLSKRTPIVNLDFSTGNRYLKHLSIYYFLSIFRNLLQRQTHNSLQGCDLFS